MTDTKTTVCIEDIPVIALVGPTAVGKTKLSIDLAHHYNCEIIGVDSMQVYRSMNIGTAKITRDEMQGVRHHLIDIIDPDEEYDAARFVRDAETAAVEISSRGKIPLMTGGTGLYLKAFTEGLFQAIPADENIRILLKDRLIREGSEKLHEELSVCDRISSERIHKNDSARILRGLEIFQASGIPWSTHLALQKEREVKTRNNTLIVGLTCERSRLYERITMRTEMMLVQGFEQEVRMLLEKGYGPELKSMGSIGYRHMVEFISGNWSESEMVEYLSRDTRRYAKRQYTWFNKTRSLEWFEVDQPQTILDRVGHWLNEQGTQ